MVNSAASGTELATIFCSGGWAFLSYKCLKDKFQVLFLGALFVCIGYVCAFVQYMYIFFIDKTLQSDIAMNWLFIRMIFHCTGTLILIYGYNHFSKAVKD